MSDGAKVRRKDAARVDAATPWTMAEVSSRSRHPRTIATVQALAAATQRAERAEAALKAHDEKRHRVETGEDCCECVDEADADAKAAHAALVEMMKERDALRAKLAEAEAWTEDDRPLPEDVRIHDAHPLRSGDHARYLEAMRLVGAKRSKYALVDLVNWLLARIADAERTNAAAREEQREACAVNLEAATGKGRGWAVNVRNTPLTATPLADEIARLTHQVGTLKKALDLAVTENSSLRAALETAREALRAFLSYRAQISVLDRSRAEFIQATKALAAIDAVKT